MKRLETYFHKMDKHKLLYDKLEAIGPRLYELADSSDRTQAFSFESISLLKGIDYHTLTVPLHYGGLGGGLYEMVLFQEQLAQYDPAIALAFGWHLSTMLDINEKQVWSLANIEWLNKQVVEAGCLVNRAATEPTSGSPTRGAMPTTVVTVIDENTIQVTGQKSYTSLSPVLDLFLVTAVFGEHKVEVAIPASTEGVSLSDDWNMVGMRGTASHLLCLDKVQLGHEGIFLIFPKQAEEHASPHLLHIPACYLGIALAARREAIAFASSYQPPSLDKPIIYTNNVQVHLGEMELALQQARSFMYYAVEAYEQTDVTERYLHVAALTSVKVAAIRSSLDVVDRAMRIVGLKSLALSHPLQRLYRDVRFGLHNPPMEDAVIVSLGKNAIDDAGALR